MQRYTCYWLEAAKHKTDFQVVFMHWAREFCGQIHPEACFLLVKDLPASVWEGKFYSLEWWGWVLYSPQSEGVINGSVYFENIMGRGKERGNLKANMPLGHPATNYNRYTL